MVHPHYNGRLQSVNMLSGSCMMVDILGSPCIQINSYASVVQRQDIFKANKTIFLL